MPGVFSVDCQRLSRHDEPAESERLRAADGHDFAIAASVITRG